MIKKRISEIAIIILVSIILLVVLEVAARLFVFQNTGKWQGTRVSEVYEMWESIDHVGRPHLFLITSPNENTTAVVHSKSAEINSLGYRSPERSLLNPSNHYRILCSGGSTTFDLHAPNNDATWPSLLEGHLSTDETGLEVWNGGYLGWSSAENIISLSLRDLDLGPDLIILFQGINDLRPLSHTPFDRQYERGQGDLQLFTSQPEPPTLYQRSVLVDQLNRMIYGEPKFINRYKPDSYSPPEIDSIPADAFDTFKRNIKTFVGIAKSIDAEVILVPQILRLRQSQREHDLYYFKEWLPSLESKRVPVEMERLNDTLRVLASENHLLLFDAPNDVLWTDADFADPMHFSAAGSRKFSKYLAHKIKETEALSSIEVGIAE